MLTAVNQSRRVKKSSSIASPTKLGKSSQTSLKEPALDETPIKQAKRVLKLNQGLDKGEFQFPARERFNEEVDDTIKSEFHVSKLRGSAVTKKSLLKDNLSAFE